MDRKCNKCKQTKPTEEFYPQRKLSEGVKVYYRGICKVCDNARIRDKTLKPEQKEKLAVKYQNNKAWFEEYKRALSCLDCGLSFQDKPWLCDFHHRDPSTKSYGISWALSHKGNKPQCDPLCSNCHRTRHYREKYLGKVST